MDTHLSSPIDFGTNLVAVFFFPPVTTQNGSFFFLELFSGWSIFRNSCRSVGVRPGPAQTQARALLDRPWANVYTYPSRRKLWSIPSCIKVTPSENYQKTPQVLQG